MTDKTFAEVADHAIDKLSGGAAKALKQVAPHAWEVAVRQQVIEGAWTLGLSMALALGMATTIIWSLIAIKRNWSKIQEAGAEPVLMLLVLLLLPLFAALDSARDGALQMSNPEYYAAKSILEAVK